MCSLFLPHHVCLSAYSFFVLSQWPGGNRTKVRRRSQENQMTHTGESDLGGSWRRSEKSTLDLEKWQVQVSSVRAKVKDRSGRCFSSCLALTDFTPLPPSSLPQWQRLSVSSNNTVPSRSSIRPRTLLTFNTLSHCSKIKLLRNRSTSYALSMNPDMVSRDTIQDLSKRKAGS